MSSYQPTILPARTTPLQHFSQGMGDMSKIIAQALIKNKYSDAERKKKTSENQKSFADAVKLFGGQKGYKTKLKYSSQGGLGLESEPMDVFKNAKNTLAFGSPDQVSALGQETGVPTTDPAMSMPDGSVGNVPSYDYQDKVRQALLPGYSQDEIKSDALGMPAKKESAIPKEFVQDFKMAHDSANGNENQFVNNLKSLTVKYSDNPAALRLIHEHLTINKVKADETDAAFNF